MSVTKKPVRILFLSDSHLGIDMPIRPRVEKRRRGPDFFRTFDLALRPALRREVDLVVHGGDLFFRSKVRAGLVHRVLERIRAVVEGGVPFLLVPGNHERSKVPLPLLWNMPGLFLFDRPRTVSLDVRGVRVGLSGFPYYRENLRAKFSKLVEATGWKEKGADIRLLCIHHIVEGATVGPGDFTFRGGPDVIPGRLLPEPFAAVLSGHIHRYQVLGWGPDEGKMGAPVLYPGSTERTSFAEESEKKGFLLLDLEPSLCGRGKLPRFQFRELPARPMRSIEVDVGGLGRWEVERKLRENLASFAPESVVRLKICGEIREEAFPVLRAACLRSLAPSTMTVEMRVRGSFQPSLGPAKWEASRGGM